MALVTLQTMYARYFVYDEHCPLLLSLLCSFLGFHLILYVCICICMYVCMCVYGYVCTLYVCMNNVNVYYMYVCRYVYVCA